MLQFKWQLVKKASQVFYLHFALKKRAFIEEIHEKQEQVSTETLNKALLVCVSLIIGFALGYLKIVCLTLRQDLMFFLWNFNLKG